MKTRAGWSPFEGYTLPGTVTHTVVRGKIYPRVED
jgi:dihydroorotase-like cyclic amidohydrolase